MAGFLRATWLIARKDLRIELRTKEVVITVGLFALLVVVLSSLAFYQNPVAAMKIAPGVMWITIAFAGVLAVGRSWERESANDVLRGLLLAPMPRGALFMGKLLANLAFVFAIEVLVVPLTALFFHVDLIPIGGMLLAIVSLGTLGFVSAGTLFGALAARSGQARDLVLSLVVFPLIAPALLGAVIATRELFQGASPAELLGWVKALLAFDLIFLAAGGVLFDPLLSD